MKKILILLAVYLLISPVAESSGFFPHNWTPDRDEVVVKIETPDLSSLAAKVRDLDRRLLDAKLELPAWELYHITPIFAKIKKMSKGDIIEMIVEVSNYKGVNPAIIMAIARAESNYNPKAISHKGAIGLMQLMPETAVELGVDPLNPVENVLGGIEYFLKMRKQFMGYTRLALAAYNAGPHNVIKAGMRVPNIAETKMYVSKVIKFYKEYNQRI